MSDKPKKAPVKLTDKQRAALDKGRKQLTKGDERTRIIQAQGVEAATIARQEQAQKRTFAALLAEALAITTAEGKTRKHGIAEGLTKALEKELAKKNPNGKTVNALYTAIRDTIGEMPTQKIDLNANVKTVGNWRDALPAVPTEEQQQEETPPPGVQNEEDERTDESTAEE